MNDSKLAGNLLDDWDRLAAKESELEMHLDQIEDSVYEKYPEVDLARVVICDILKMTERTPLHRRLFLMRMEEHACHLIQTVDREIGLAKKQFEVELKAIKQLRIETEAQIIELARKRHATDAKKKSAKRARRE